MDVFSWMFFSSVKEINRLINKRLLVVTQKSDVWEKNCENSTYYFKFERNYDIATSNQELSIHLTNFE